MTATIHPVILCGGSGTRLWPLSTPKIPKQFLALTSENSMIVETADRFTESHDADLNFAAPLIVGSKRHAELLEEHLPGVRKILEPFGRNSAPAVAAASLLYDPEDFILILPADHNIRDVSAFHKAISSAAKSAEESNIVTFGIHPTYPATSYGYIRVKKSTFTAEAIGVEQFVEKPDLATAKEYLEQGSYFWNAGIFLFKSKTMLDALEVHAPDVLAGTRSALGAKSDVTVYLDAVAFSTTPTISIDYAVLEKATNVKTVPVSMGWSDVGGFNALHKLLSSSAKENYSSGPVFLQDCEGLYVRSEGPVITVNGVSDLAIVATDTEVMITPLNHDTAVKELGSAAQYQRHTLGFSVEHIDEARTWLWNTLHVWSNKAWDEKRGGFVENLAMDGTPDYGADRRVRVHARQIFAFAEAIELGWPGADNARELVEKGVNYLDTRLRHSEGGWVKRVNAQGHPIDDRRDLYDHAFIILAGATAFKTTGNARALRIADDAITFIDSQMKDKQKGGWVDTLPLTLSRRANPHMHLLEAMMGYHDATGCKDALARASEVVRLFETRFFNPATDVMAEAFDQDWNLVTSDEETVFEPGHHYEWAALLWQFQQMTGHDTQSWRRRLIRSADQLGRNLNTGFAFNEVQANGIITDPSSRLWHQLEMFRAHLMHPNVSQVVQTETLFKQIFEAYLRPGPAGGWIDEIDDTGRPISTHVPASMLYHTVTALRTAF